MTTIVCPHCQTENEENATQCVICGQPLAAQAPKGQAPEGQADRAEGQHVREEVEDWVRQLPGSGSLKEVDPDVDDENLPAWLQAVRSHADKLSDDEANELIEFLGEAEPEDAGTAQEKPQVETARPRKSGALPAWMAALEPDESQPGEGILAEQENDERTGSTAPLPSTSPLTESGEMQGIPELLAGDDLPDWLREGQFESEPYDSDVPPEWPVPSTRYPTAPIEQAKQPTEPVTETSSVAGHSSAADDLEAILGELDGTIAQEAAAVAASAKEAEPDLPAGDANWMDLARAAALEESLEGMIDLPDGETSAERVDQWLDILDALPSEGETEQFSEMMSGAELETDDVPAWVESLQPEAVVDDEESMDLEPAVENGPLAGLRGVVPLATIGLTANPDRSSSKLILTKEERQQAALLRQLTSTGPEATMTKADKDVDTQLLVRVILGGILVLVIALGLLVPGVAGLMPDPAEPVLPAAAAQAADTIAANAGNTALVAFDYTPTMSGELDAVASSLLQDLAAKDYTVLTISQVAAGVPMAEQAVADVEGLNAESLGYLPGEASGLRAIGSCIGANCESLLGRTLDAEKQTALAGVKLIIILSADRDSLVGWLEQVGTINEVPLIAGVTQALGPVARPYYQSDQLAGLLEGLPVSVVYAETSLPENMPPSEFLTSFTLAQWLAIAVLIVGALYFGLTRPGAPALTQVTKK